MIADGFFFGLGLAAAGLFIVGGVLVVLAVVVGVREFLDWATRAPK